MPGDRQRLVAVDRDGTAVRRLVHGLGGGPADGGRDRHVELLVAEPARAALDPRAQG